MGNINGIVYAAGPITGLSYEDATSWRKYLYKNLIAYNILVIDPLRKQEFLQNEQSLKSSYERTLMSSSKSLTSRSKWDTLRSDLIFVNLLNATKVSIGTVMEIVWADMKDIPIILCIDNGGLHDHAMLKETSSFVVNSLDDGIDVIKMLLFPYKLT